MLLDTTCDGDLGMLLGFGTGVLLDTTFDGDSRILLGSRAGALLEACDDSGSLLEKIIADDRIVSIEECGLECSEFDALKNSVVVYSST